MSGTEVPRIAPVQPAAARHAGPAVFADEVLYSLGTEYALHLFHELGHRLGQDAPEAGPTSRLARVRYRRAGWSPSTATRAALYARPGDAHKAMWQLRAEGYRVELSVAERGPWTLRWPAPFSTGPVAERWRQRAAELGVDPWT